MAQNSALKRIDGFLTWRSRLPPLMNPQPLIGMRAHIALDHAGESRRVLAHILFLISAASQFNRAAELQSIFVQAFIPAKESGNDRGVRAQGDARETGGGGSGNAEKIDEDSFVKRGVMVAEDSYRSSFAQKPQHGACGAILVDRPVSRAAAVAVDQIVDAPIGDGANQEMERVPVERVREGRQFPGAHVAGEKQHSFAAALGFGEVFRAVYDDDLFDRLARVFRELREFADHPADLPDHSPNRMVSLRLAPFRKRNFEIALRDAVKSRLERVDDRGEASAKESRHAPRQKSQQSESSPGGEVFQALPHRVPLCASRAPLRQRAMVSSRQRAAESPNARVLDSFSWTQLSNNAREPLRPPAQLSSPCGSVCSATSGRLDCSGRTNRGTHGSLERWPRREIGSRPGFTEARGLRSRPSTIGPPRSGFARISPTNGPPACLPRSRRLLRPCASGGWRGDSKIRARTRAACDDSVHGVRLCLPL